MTSAAARYTLVLGTVLTLGVSTVAAADAAASAERPYWRKNLFKRILGDQKYLVTEWWPAEFRRPRFSAPLGAAVVAAAGSSSGGVDRRSQRWFENWTDGHAHGAARFFSQIGDGGPVLLAVGGTYLVSRWTGSERGQRVASLSAEALIDGAIYSTLLKRLTRRTRPANGGTGQFFVSNPEGGESATSFPSGHATGAFAVAAVLSREFREKRWVPWVARGTATLIALSRVGLGRHFPSDVMFGAVLGDSVGRAVMERGGDGGDARLHGRVEPLVAPDGRIGLGYRRSW